MSPKDRKRFEAMARSHFSNESHSCAAFMRHKDIMISPKLLRNAGIDYTVVSMLAAAEHMHCAAAGQHAFLSVLVAGGTAAQFTSPLCRALLLAGHPKS